MLHLKQDCASAELKKKTIHMLSFSYFAVVFLNKMDQTKIPLYLQEIKFQIWKLWNCTILFSVNYSII